MARPVKIQVQVWDGPLPERDPWSVEGAGAVVCFEGIVRPLEGEHEIAALVYEDYEPMTTSELEKLAVSLVEKHSLLAIRVEHGRGRIPVGATAFRLTVASQHRKEALRATSEFIDSMKQNVPLWKSPQFREEGK